jgi:hypothetical protein
MAKFLCLWYTNPNAPWPADPVENAKMLEMTFAAMDNLLKTGDIQEFGFFPDAKSGYAIKDPCESKDAFRLARLFYPYYESEVCEMIPYETGKEIVRAVLKAQAEAMKQ